MKKSLEINAYDHEGRGIGKLDGKVVFVPNTVPGDVVEVNVVKEKKNYLEAEVVNFISYSSKRIESKCPYFEKCGGCSYQNISLEDEESIKLENVKNIIKRYAGLEIEPKFISSNKDLYYRNKIELKIENFKWGYYNSLSHNFIEISNCLIAKESINNIINNKNYFNIKNGEIIIRSNYNDEIIIKISTIDTYSIDINNLIKNNKIVGIIINDKVIYGEDYYIERLGGFLFKVNINSFFQVNLDVLNKIFDLIKKDNYGNVVDLYCGVGTLGIAANKERLYGIEVVKEAVKDAISNSKLNKQDNLYILGDSSKINKINDQIDTIIVDPPRSGLNKETLSNILNKNVKKMIYMSCNPLTLARDLSILKNNYKISDFYVLNMFPRTKHVECVCVLEEN